MSDSIDPKWLRQRYIVDAAPVEDIAAEAGVNVATVYRARRRAGIPARGRPGFAEPVELDRVWLGNRVAEGMNPHAIAAQAGVDRSAVVWQLARHQLLNLIDEPRAVHAAQMYQQGATLGEVAAATGVGRKRVTVWLMAQGVPIHGPGRRPTT